MQQAKNSLNALFEGQIVAKKELRDLILVIQNAYLHMYSVEKLENSKLNSLISSKAKEFNLTATQQFIAEASLLAKKW
jgi:hypothetical protein